MDNVRKAASVSGSQLAHYFADKSALIRAVIGRQIGVVLDFHRQPKLRGLDSFDDFERWIDLNMRYLRRIGYLRHTHLPCADRAAGEVRRRDARHLGGGLLAMGRAARSGDPADEGSRRSGRGRRPATVGAGHRLRSPGRSHAGLHLSGGMAARRRHPIRGQLPAHVRHRPRRTGAAPTAASPRPARDDESS